MAKAVVYVLLTTAFVLLMTLSPLIRDQRRGPSLNRRFGYDIQQRVPSFDPLITKIERSKEEHKQVVHDGDRHEPEPEPEPTANTSLYSDSADAYQSMTTAGRLNTTLRLMILFPLLDKEPKDGVIDYNELETWIIQQAMDRLDYMTNTELQEKDKNGDRAISFREYLPQFSEKDIERKSMGHGEAGWWLERFNKADGDGNGLLHFSEFRDFLHPQDSKNEKLLKWLLTDRIRRIDEEIDGKLNFKEFNEKVYNMFKTYAEYETAGQFVPSAEKKFSELDANNDEFLSVEELMGILRYLYPGELSYAKYYTSYLMNVADDDRDGRLSLEEMLNHEFAFYSTVHADEHEESDDDHDEL
ncbi:hypothetical protein L6164_016347 [Bauhinia variegata]|uniref:Uncharacterized protein n=1 Tax=Bauhinia variegata TaxID=167791 RepID=A0ACB9NRA9_BAUVA|nr:hypothetical protein L6164_016347 [Bauhinia variegata]